MIPSLSDPEIAGHLTSFLTFRMARTQNKLNSQITYYLKTYSDLTLVDWRVLRLLEAMEEATMAQVARLLQMDKGQLSRKTRTLLERGFMSSRIDPDDNRKQLIKIEDAGRKLIQLMLPRVEQRQKLLVEGITPQEMEIFMQVLERIDIAAARRDPL